MEMFDNYDELYPELTLEILEYFDISRDEQPVDKSIRKLAEKYSVPRDDGTGYNFTVNPNILKKICDKLQAIGLECTKRSAFSTDNNYLFCIKDKSIWDKKRQYLKNYYNSLVYGKQYIYKTFKRKVLPLVVKNNQGKESIGTCFRFMTGIVTAKHCLIDAERVSICGISAEVLETAKIFVSENQNIDLAYIELNESSLEIYYDDPIILDDVIVLGYPKIPGFVNFLTAESASISAISEKSIVQTHGSIAAIDKNIFAKINMMLITAKIRGGNSGGPVINEYGCIVGVACQSPDYEGDYDDLGYGIALPIEHVINIVKEKHELKNIRFYDYEY